MIDAPTQRIRQALVDADFVVAQGGELLNHYPHIRVQHGGWLQDEYGYRRRWHLWFRYAFPGDPTDEAYDYEARAIRTLHGGEVAMPDGDGIEMRIYRAPNASGGGDFRFLASRIPFVEL